MKKTHFAPGWHSKTPPEEAEMKIFQNQNVPDIIPMMLTEKYKRIQPEKMKTQFAPGWHSKTPLGEAQMNFFPNENVPDIIPMILEEKYNKFEPKNI